MSADGRLVVGFIWRKGSWDRKPSLAQFEPLFDRGHASSQAVVARKGYVVGGIQIDASEFVHAARVIFVAVDAQGVLNKRDSYTSDWLGERSSQTQRTIGDGATPVIGIHGRRGAVVDSLGVVFSHK